MVGVWIDKAIGLIMGGFVPTPIGELLVYTRTTAEILVSLGICAIGLWTFTLLAEVAIPIELGDLRHSAAPPPSAAPMP